MFINTVYFPFHTILLHVCSLNGWYFDDESVLLSSRLFTNLNFTRNLSSYVHSRILVIIWSGMTESTHARRYTLVWLILRWYQNRSRLKRVCFEELFTKYVRVRFFQCRHQIKIPNSSTSWQSLSRKYVIPHQMKTLCGCYDTLVTHKKVVYTRRVVSDFNTMAALKA